MTFYFFKQLHPLIKKAQRHAPKGLLCSGETAPNTYILFVYVFYVHGASAGGTSWMWYGYIIICCGCCVMACCAAAGYILYIILYIQCMRKSLLVAAPRRGLSAVYIVNIYYIYNIIYTGCTLKYASRIPFFVMRVAHT